MLSPQQKQNLVDAAKAAVAAEGTTGCPAELTVPQWAVESGWGLRMPPGSNNPFGIKALPGQASVTANTVEVTKGTATEIPQEFRKFDTLQDAFVYHGSLIATGAPYGAAFDQYEQNGDVVGLIQRISPRYSTSPVYAKTLTTILNYSFVQQAIADARNA